MDMPSSVRWDCAAGPPGTARSREQALPDSPCRGWSVGDARAAPAADSGPERQLRKAGEVTKRLGVYELKIRGVASDVVRAEFDDVELWEVPGATWLRTGGADTATLYGLIRRIETLGLVLLKVDAVDAGESDDPAPS
jgi:hypothetical protein